MEKSRGKKFQSIVIIWKRVNVSINHANDIVQRFTRRDHDFDAINFCICVCWMVWMWVLSLSRDIWPLGRKTECIWVL